jgi:hypothetical protein
MKNAFRCALLIGAIAGAGTAIADDSMSRATPTDSQRLKDCIEKQKQADVNMSKAQMTRICKDKLKQQKSGGEPVDPPPTDTPKT